MHQQKETFFPVPERLDSEVNGRTLRLERLNENGRTAIGQERLQRFVEGRGFVNTLACRLDAMPRLREALDAQDANALLRYLALRGTCRHIQIGAQEKAWARWESVDSRWQLVIETESLDVRGRTTPPAPFTGTFDVRLLNAPSDNAHLILENVSTGHVVTVGEPREHFVVSEGERFHVRSIDMARLIRQPPSVDTGKL
jgi:hypothetical protein